MKLLIDWDLLHEALICLESNGHTGGGTETYNCDSCKVVNELHAILDESEPVVN